MYEKVKRREKEPFIKMRLGEFFLVVKETHNSTFDKRVKQKD